MKLYLVRHGEALDASEDPQRPLNTEGVDQVSRVAQFLGQAGVNVSTVFHSQKLRAKQTAEIISARIACTNNLTAKDDLHPNDDPQPVYNDIIRNKEDLMFVGHLPFLGRLASLLVLGHEDNNLIKFNPATVVILEGAGFQPFSIIGVISPGML